jgi:hypothetical protein
MKLSVKALREKSCLALLVLLVVSFPICLDTAWSYDSPGLSIGLYPDQRNPDLRFTLGENPVALVVVVSNTEGRQVVTERGFSQIELRYSLIVTDPNGAKHVLNQGAHKMPPPYDINDQPWALAESLPANWVRSATIDDLREYVPVMKTLPGWYTVEARQPFLRFAMTGQDSGLGFLGLLDQADNWSGEIKSNVLQLYVAPALGAQVTVQVMNQAVSPAEPLAQVPVKILRNSDISAGYTLQDSWDKVVPALVGTTDFKGTVVWKSVTPCLLQASYTILALYGGVIKSEPITNSTTEGWAQGCTGQITKTVRFGEIARTTTISGGGWINPETTVYKATLSVDITAIGRAISGSLNYHYVRTRMVFKSSGISEVAVAGSRAVVKGVGTVNKVAGYSFEAEVIDGRPDQFGIVIRRADGTTYYSTAAKRLGGGNLTIKVQ